MLGWQGCSREAALAIINEIDTKEAGGGVNSQDVSR